MTTATDILSEAATLLGDSGQVFHTQAKLLVYLNRALKEVCNRAKCIRETRYVSAVADQYEYGLPNEFLQVDMVAYNDGRWKPLYNRRLAGIHNDRYYGNQSGTPEAFDVWGNSRIERASGTATGGGATSLVDTAKTFNAGANLVYVGDLIFNTTDDSEGVVTGLTGATQVDFSAGLAGGSDNTFAASDAYFIVSPHAPNMALLIHPAPGSSDATGTEKIAYWGARKHRAMTAAQMSISTDWLELPEELETALMRRVMQYAQEEEYGVDSKESIAQFSHYQTEYQENIGYVRQRIRSQASTWIETLGTNRIITVTGTNRTANPFNTNLIN